MPLTKEQIEAWRNWHNKGHMVDFYAGAFDVLCDMALASLVPEEKAIEALKVARNMIRGEAVEHAVVDVQYPDVGLGDYLDAALFVVSPQKATE